MKKKVKIIVTLLVILVVVIAAGFMTKKWWAGADINQTGNKASSELEKYYLNGKGFVPGELIIELNQTENPSSLQQTAESVFSKENSKIDIKETIPMSQISATTYKIKFDVPKEGQFNQASQEKISSAGGWQAAKKILDNTEELKGKISLETTIALKTTLALKESLAKDPRFKAVYLNQVYRVSGLPNDTYINPSKDGITWSTGAFGQSYEDLWGLKQSETDKAWEISTGKGVVVAVVDTGVDFTHPDIRDNILTQENKPGTDITTAARPSGHMICYNAAENNDKCMDNHGHGTHVAGIIAAIKNNNRGIAGVAPEAKIMPVKVLDDRGYGTDDWISQGIRYATDNGANVINMSLGGYGSSPIISQAIDYASSKDVLVVVAAGNDAMDLNMFFPASNQKVITVGAANEKKQTTFFSNFGSGLKVVAPGGGSVKSPSSGTIINSWDDLIGGNPNINNVLSLRSAKSAIGGDLIVGDQYLRLAGTSMASPYVAGVVSLIKSKNPTYTAEQIKTVLYKSAQDVTKPYGDGDFLGWDSYTGYGFIDAYKALTTTPSAMPVAKLEGPIQDIISIQEVSDYYEVRGSAGGSNFKNFSVYLGKADLGSGDYYPQNFEPIVSGSTQKITNGVLAKIEKRKISNPEKQFFVIKLDVEGNDGLKNSVTKHLITSKDEKNGFPRKLDLMLEGYDSIVADVDNNGKKEIIFRDGYGSVHGVDEDGKILNNWEAGEIGINIYINPFILEKNNGDKLVLFSYISKNSAGKWSTKLIAFDGKKGIKANPAWSKTLEEGVDSPGWLSGLSLEKGSDKLIAINFRDQLNIYSADGEIVKNFDNILVNDMAAGDIDGDNEEELVIAGFREFRGEMRQGIFAIDINSSEIQNIKILNSGDSMNYYLGQIKLGDFDQDSKLDYAFYQGESFYRSTIFVLSNNKKVIFKKTRDNVYYGFDTRAGVYLPALGDVDNNNYPEVMITNLKDLKAEFVNGKGKIIKNISDVAWFNIDYLVDIDSDGVADLFEAEPTTHNYYWTSFEEKLNVYSPDKGKIKNYSMPGVTIFPFFFRSENKGNMVIGTYNPLITLMHRFEYNKKVRFDWPSFYHDARKTNNWHAEQID